MSKRITVNRRQILAAGAGALSTGILPRVAMSQGAPVNVGVILYLSGVQAFMGQQTRKGNEFGATFAKEAGGPPIEFIYGDAEFKPENGRVVAERLIRDGCTLLIGTNDSGSTISVAQAAEAAQNSVPDQYRLGAADHRTRFHPNFSQLPSGHDARRQRRCAHQGAGSCDWSRA